MLKNFSRDFVRISKNFIKVVKEDPDLLYGKQIAVFSGLGMLGGIYLGAQETRRYSNTSFMDHVSNISIGGCAGAFCGAAFGLVSPIIIPVGFVCGIASLGMYGYNKINPVIPWHQKQTENKNLGKELIDDLN